MNTFLSNLREERNQLKATIENALDIAATENRDLSDAEDTNVNGAYDRIKELDERIEHLSEIELRNAAASELAAKVDGARGHSGVAVVNREERTYRPDVTERSYFKDLVNYGKAVDATERLNRHNQETMIETRTTATSGLAGFVPPQYLVSQYAELARGTRPTANIVPGMGAPSSNLFYIPKISSGLSVGFQSAENATFTSADLAATNVTVAARTLGGYTDVSRQTLDLGALPDSMIFGDLVRAHAVQVETMVLSSSTTNNEGITTTSGITTVSYTDSTPTVAELQGQVGYAISQIHTNRYAAPEVIILDPVMWNWIKSRSDTAGRPLVAPYQPQNASAQFGTFGAEGIVGEFYGLPVCVTSALGLVSEATPSKRQVVIARISDSMLWESTPQVDVFNDVGSATATVRFRLMNYVAQTHARQPKSIANVYGTGTAISSASF